MRIKELCKEENVSHEELAKLIGVDVDEFCQLQNYNDYRAFNKNQLEIIAMRLGVTVTYLKGNTPYVSQEEREYRNNLKQMAQAQLDITEYNFHPSNNLDSSYGVTAQLCIAANLVTLIESIERLTDKIDEHKK